MLHKVMLQVSWVGPLLCSWRAGLAGEAICHMPRFQSFLMCHLKKPLTLRIPKRAAEFFEEVLCSDEDSNEAPTQTSL